MTGSRAPVPVLAATNNNDRKKKYDKGVSNTPHAASRPTPKKEKEVKYYYCCDLICNIIGGLTAPAKERDVEYYHCCDLLIAGLDNTVLLFDVDLNLVLNFVH